MSRKYKITYKIIYTNPTEYNHCMTDEYVIDGIEQLEKILNEVLDAPAAKLTHEQVEKEFSGEIKLSEQKLTAIMKYYNGRFDLLNCILKEFAEQNENMNSVIYIKHDIPAECNSFVDICNMTATIEVKTV